MSASSGPMGLLYTTWPDAGSAEAAAEALLAEGLIACANIMGEARSLFRWQGEVQRESEIIALFKTGADKAERTAKRIADLHPYDEPAVLNLCVDPTGSSSAFIAWVASQTGEPPR